MPSVDFIIRESDAEYREKAKTYLSSHALADFRNSPLLYWKKKQGLVPDQDRPAYLLGRAVHTWVLEGSEEFARRYALGGPVNKRTGKPYGQNTQAWAQWAAAEGKPALTHDQFELVKAIGVGVGAHTCACELLREGIAECVARAEYGGVPCQARLDWFNPERGIVDLKTCDELTWFEADARRYGYVYQMAFYRAVLVAASGTRFPVHLIAVEKKEPFRCGLWRVDDGVLNAAEKENAAAIKRLKSCLESDTWKSGYEEPRVFDCL